MPSKCPLLWGVKSILWRGALQKNDTRSGKSDRSCRLFCAFSICDDTGRRQWRNYVGMHVATTAEGISNCFKIKPSLFLLHTFGHHLEHERLSNFSNFCKTKTLAYFWKTRPPEYFWIEISLFSLPFPFMQEKQNAKFDRRKSAGILSILLCFSCEIPKWLLWLMDGRDKIWACTKYIDAFRWCLTVVATVAPLPVGKLQLSLKHIIWCQCLLDWNERKN